MRLLFWAFVCALILVGGWELHNRHHQRQMYAGTVYYTDGRPMQPIPPADAAPQPADEASAAASPERPLPAPVALDRTADAPLRIPPPAPAQVIFSSMPPSGVAFAAIGSYQWYQQGALTWRLDLQSGASCVAFATPEAWQKPTVYRHSCNRV